MEQEVYIDKISREYDISKEAIYAEINKINHSRNQGKKILEAKTVKRVEIKKEEIPETIIKRENIIIALLLNGKEETYKKIKDKLTPDDFRSDNNKKIVKCLYEEFEKGNSNISNILELLENDEQAISRITEIMADDYEIKDDNKAIDELINNYQREKLKDRKQEIVSLLSNSNEEDSKELEKELHDIILKLAKIKWYFKGGYT